MFVFCMQCAYMKYTGWEFDIHAKDLFRPFGAPSPGMPLASRASRPCAGKAARFARVAGSAEGLKPKAFPIGEGGPR